ncbi:MAG: succinate dehydrogenase, cytochrome b556 subunit [Parvularculaceae bacterium]
MAEGTPARPLSPHLQIWRWSPTMASSIMHRATGVALYAGTILLALWFAAIALGRDAYEPAAAVLGSPIGLIVLFGFAWALLFHSFNGLRHLYWDSGRGLDPKTARRTSIAMFLAASLGAGAIFFLALADRGGL